MKLSFPAARNLLSLCEYHYRLGVWHGCSTPDGSEVTAITDREDAYSTFQYVGDELRDPTKVRQLFTHVDMLIATCRKLTADSLATYLRLEKSRIRLREICAIIDYHYRKGLKAGTELVDENGARDMKKAKAFLESVGRGTQHPHLFDRQKWDTFQYFDTVKHRINKIHALRHELGLPTGAYTLSIEIGKIMMTEKLKIYADR